MWNSLNCGSRSECFFCFFKTGSRTPENTPCSFRSNHFCIIFNGVYLKMYNNNISQLRVTVHTYVCSSCKEFYRKNAPSSAPVKLFCFSAFFLVSKVSQTPLRRVASAARSLGPQFSDYDTSTGADLIKQATRCILPEFRSSVVRIFREKKINVPRWSY
jgi:hypothetical protein